jgi:hypothetical protein
LGGSAKDVYDMYLWAGRPFDQRLVRRLAILKAWTDRRPRPLYEPEAFLRQVQPGNFRWTDISGLVPRRLESNPERICSSVRDRFAFLSDCSDEEQTILNDQTAHAEHRLFNQLREEARQWSDDVPR